MDAKTLEALKASIAKWERNAEAKRLSEVFLGCLDCPLCQIFHTVCGGNDCEGCPVSTAGHHRCGGSPYEDADEAAAAWDDSEDDDGIEAEAFRKVARAEVTFLKSLLPTEG